MLNGMLTQTEYDMLPYMEQSLVRELVITDDVNGNNIYHGSCGVVNKCTCFSKMLNAPYTYISYLFVHPKHRRKGIAKKLIMPQSANPLILGT